MAKARLNKQARALLADWFAAGHPDDEIIGWAAQAGLPNLDAALLTHYRRLLAPQIEAAEGERRKRVLSTGLARREERVARLVRHAEEIERLRLDEDANGRLTHAREWRETLADIAAETGGRKPQPGSGEQVVKVYVGFDPERV